jgi:hypothetical protein
MTGASRIVRRPCWYRAGVVAVGLAVLLVQAVPAYSQEVGYSASVYAARSTYPTDRITSAYLFNSVDMTAGPVRASVSVPFIRQRITFTGEPIDPATGADVPLESTTTGWGDPLVRVDVRLLDDRRHALQIGVAGSVKLPVVNADSGRGTGVADVGVGGSVFKASGRTSVFGDLLFWKYGDPEGIDFENTLSYSVGVGRVLWGGRWSALVSLAGFSSGIDGAPPPVQLNLGVLALAAGRQSVALTAGIGLTDSSGLSIGTSWRIAR